MVGSRDINAVVWSEIIVGRSVRPPSTADEHMGERARETSGRERKDIGKRAGRGVDKLVVVLIILGIGKVADILEGKGTEEGEMTKGETQGCVPTFYEDIASIDHSPIIGATLGNTYNLVFHLIDIGIGLKVKDAVFEIETYIILSGALGDEVTAADIGII